MKRYKKFNEKMTKGIGTCVSELEKKAKGGKVTHKQVEDEMVQCGLHPDDDYPDVEDALEGEGITVKK